MNFTICGKTDKVIRNWEKQCFVCEHACLVIAQGTNNEGIIIEYGGIFLFSCPHVRRQHKIIGQDSKKSQPDTRTDMVSIPCCIPFISKNIKESLSWEDLPIPFSSTESTRIAKIPRERWKELLSIEVSDIPEPCSICN